MISPFSDSEVNFSLKFGLPVFTIIIPTHNNAKTIERAVKSVQKQPSELYQLIVVDDCSTDGTREIVRNLPKDIDKVLLNEHAFNGGARNCGVEFWQKTYPGLPSYILFLDADDEFENNFLRKLLNLICKAEYPDMVRLPYETYYDTKVDGVPAGTVMPKVRQILKEESLEDVAHSTKVACWTKAVKSTLFVPFPENTLMEDACQHLAQVDVCSSVAYFPEVVVRWHVRGNSTSHNNSPKWQSSAWRFVADLMDLDLKESYTRARRDVKVKDAQANLLKGLAVQ